MSRVSAAIERQRLAEIADPVLHQNRLVGIQPLLAGLAGDVGGRRAVGEVVGGQHAGDTPGSARAFATSRRTSRALAMSARTTRMCSMFGIT